MYEGIETISAGPENRMDMDVKILVQGNRSRKGSRIRACMHDCSSPLGRVVAAKRLCQREIEKNQAVRDASEVDEELRN